MELECEIRELKEYKADIERLATDDSLWQKVADYDVIKEKYKNAFATLLIQEHKLDKIKYEFIDCDEYPPLTKFWKEEILDDK
jgi:hypothetical protein